MLVSSSVIKEASLRRSVPIQWHIYGIPFMPIYGIYLYCYIYEYPHAVFSVPEFAKFFLILTCSLHALTFLICQWSINARSFFTTTSATLSTAQMIKIIPSKFNGVGAICPLSKTKDNQQYFEFQKIKYFYDSDKKTFLPLEYLFDHSFNHFKSYKGLTETSFKKAQESYGMNLFHIPIPTYKDLMIEHIQAPFFVFQLFCVALWFLDDMWYFSLFTLFMLFVFESTLVAQRLKNLSDFRTMSTKPYPIQVFRNSKWSTITTDQLVPGDLCSIVRSAEDCPVPCDLLVLNGTCIVNEAMLSGESTPQLKEPVLLREDNEDFIFQDDKIHILYGGTKILQVQKPGEDAFIQTPDNGCLAYVLQTGFSTQQGELVRMILYSTERVTANNAESLFFILFLLVFAIIASWYVWTESLKNEERKRSKVLLDCILIITSVVPPELPMELSLAVNNSLIALAKNFIFCTEPFRIPFAGKLDITCFDKTGTLTEENLRFEGVSGLSINGSDQYQLIKPPHLPTETVHVLAGAHSVIRLQDGVVGDPMEKNTVESIGWTVDSNETMKRSNQVLKIQRRFPFSSSLKRMSSVCKIVDENNKSCQFVAVKGAPEVLLDMFSKKSVPEDYERVYKSWAIKGSRVLALGYRKITKEIPFAKIKDIHRTEVECDLEFAGFLVFYCPLKQDSAKAVSMLSASSHKVVMITGDNPLTACHVAQTVKIVRKPVLIGDIWGNQGFHWKTVDEKTSVPAKAKLSELSKYDLCITGNGLVSLIALDTFKTLLVKIAVYARVSPNQKEFILSSMKREGFVTLMCGDGTNDVGALKQADIGIALLDGSVEDMEKIANNNRLKMKQNVYEKQCEFADRMGVPRPPVPPGLKAAPSKSITGTQLNNRQNMEKAVQDMMGDVESDVPQIKFGDASVAAPFTSKISSVMSVVNVVRQGRSTLVATIQMYKILALNCIISAYSMSVLYLSGIKQGDWQATVAGLLLTICFFGIAKSNALEKLSKKRPQPNIWNAYLILSILGQSVVHIGALVYIRQQGLDYAVQLDEHIRLDAEFQPNLLNTVIYLISLTMQIATFAVNYQGEPFRESLKNNKPLFNSLVIVSLIAVCAASEISVDLNEWMQLVPMPNEVYELLDFNQMRVKLLFTMGLDVCLSFLWESGCSYLFSDNKPKKGLE